MRPKLIISLILAVVISVVTNKIVYFGFTPNYPNEIYVRNGFNFHYSFGEYKYHLLSKALLLQTDSLLYKQIPEKPVEGRLTALSGYTSERFYYAFYYLNTFFLVLTSIMAVLLMRLDRSYSWTKPEFYLVLFLLPIVIGLSEYTVAVEDVSSYFFELLILFIFLQYYPVEPVFTVGSIGILIILNTANGGSSFLSVSLLAAISIARFGINRHVLINIAIFLACFLVTYIVLRYHFKDFWPFKPKDGSASVTLRQNLYGVLFWLLFGYLPFAVAGSKQNRLLIGLFFLLSVPYIVFCLIHGTFWEVRSFIPLFLGALFLSRLEGIATPLLGFCGEKK